MNARLVLPLLSLLPALAFAAPADRQGASKGVELPEGAELDGKWEDGAPMKLAPPEAVALMFLSDIVSKQIACRLEYGKYCTIRELVAGVKHKVFGTIGLTRDPADDVNYAYEFSVTGPDTYRITAIPRRPGLGGWLFEQTEDMASYHFNPKGQATAKDRKIGDEGFSFSGGTFAR